MLRAFFAKIVETEENIKVSFYCLVILCVLLGLVIIVAAFAAIAFGVCYFAPFC